MQGFLPEDIDNLVTTFVYPASLPTLVAFLASSLFLLLKVRAVPPACKATIIGIRNDEDNVVAGQAS